ncbi:hypothetical protein [Sphingomonas sp. IW22]|uniref:hypothetical protein n=1 Tax=Sphingomonas sp. IW22 TaxID=3242489 RepID=UPI003522D6B0
MTIVQLNTNLLRSVQPLPEGAGTYRATLKAHGLFQTFQFVLRLSPEVHRRLASNPGGIVSSGDLQFDQAQAFSTYLHETVHWWQHIGSTYGLMLSLSYPTQAHANYTRLKNLIALVGFKKSVRQLAASSLEGKGPDTPAGEANIIVNNHFDFGAFRDLTFSHITAKATAEAPLFESVGHAFQISYANNLSVLASTVDRAWSTIPHPKEWGEPFSHLRKAKERGFYYGSPIELWPLGAREVLEGQACFSQIQFLHFASGGRLGWDDFKALGILHGMYLRAFEQFLRQSGLEWPPSIDDPTVGLFLLICDMAINSGSGFPHRLVHFPSFVTDTDPAARFVMLSALVRLKCPEVANVVRNYSRAEYVEVTEKLASGLLVDTPLAVANTCAAWAAEDGPFSALMGEHRTFQYDPTNLPVRVMFSHFLAFMRDKALTPEIFCWPGAWMAGLRVHASVQTLFERHSALFVDKEDDDGVFPRLQSDRDMDAVQRMFESFYAANVTYDMTDQWIRLPGPFTYDYRWLSASGEKPHMKQFADHHFQSVYGIHPDRVTLL